MSKKKAEQDAETEQAVHESFKSGPWSVDYIHVPRGDLSLMHSGEPTFDDLAALAERFGTKRINLTSKVVQEGYCETCSYTVGRVVVEISKITRWVA